MFGYICVNENELKIKDYQRYQSYYCGLCKCLHRQSGYKGQLLLNYDMTFLAILLSGLYEPKEEAEEFRCPLHPLQKKTYVKNECTQYVADMTVLLSWQKMRDDYVDDKNLLMAGATTFLKNRYQQIREKYPRQANMLEKSIEELREAEQRGETDVDTVANLSGKMFTEIFAWKEDEWANDLRDIGFYLGKFIYLVDAYEDLEKDRKKNAYNVLNLKKLSDEDLELYCYNLFPVIISEGTKVFERLPVIKDAEILRNIMYSGVWCKYFTIRDRREKEREKNGKSAEE